jgi:hypothetical protein
MDQPAHRDRPTAAHPVDTPCLIGLDKYRSRSYVLASLRALHLDRPPSSPMRRSRPAAPSGIIAQVVLVGPQLLIARVFGRNEGWDRPYISLRIGKLLINIEDAEALSDLTYLVREANLMADRAFGRAQRRRLAGERSGRPPLPLVRGSFEGERSGARAHP